MDSLTQLRDQVRLLVVGCAQSQPGAKAVLAQALEVPEVSVERMLAKDKWDLSLALASADALGMKLHVVNG